MDRLEQTFHNYLTDGKLLGRKILIQRTAMPPGTFIPKETQERIAKDHAWQDEAGMSKPRITTP